VPELPEVELMTRNVRRWSEGASLVSVDVLDPKIIRMGEELVPSLANETVVNVSRRAKYTVMETENRALVFHFRMTGKLIPEALAKKSRFTMTFDNGAAVSFADTRRLGEVFVMLRDALPAFFHAKKLGPEPYPEVRDALWWRARVESSSRAIKPTLMEQERVAGIGNILASELCFRAGIEPNKRAKQVTDVQWVALAEAWPVLIEAVLQHEAGDEIAYMGDGGGGAGTVFEVYGRDGAPCVVCELPVQRRVQSGRSTFWCARCQT
jgi:formamidopyrimidine-DNA glycosylase